jgi:catechol 2,3-dioxygenase-like lactoylglutathione lyase family enzyme
LNISNSEKTLVIGYRHTGLIVTELDKSLIFYRDVLGLKVIQEHLDESEYISKITGLKGLVAKYAKLEIPGGSVIELLTYPSHFIPRVDVPIHNIGEAHLAFSVESSADAFIHLTGMGIHCLSEPVLSSEGIAKVFFCLDPDNYRVEIVEML